VHDIETANVSFTVHNDTRTAHVATTSDHGDVASLKRNEIGDLVLLDVELHGIINPDERVRVTDGAAVVGGDVWYPTGTEGDTANLE
jgi:hypothetical protein